MAEQHASSSVLANSSPPPSLGWPVAYVAARVGVSISTLRSWERRYGLGPSGRTDGGHRRYTTDDIAAMLRLRRFVAEGMSTSAAAAAVRNAHSVTVPHAADPLEQQFLDAIEALDGAAIAAALYALLVERGAIEAWTEVVTPFLQRLGVEWAGTGTGIECEHVAVASIMSTLDRWTWEQRPGGPAPVAILAAVERDHHTAPLHALAAALAERGVDSILLGSLPDASLYAAVARLSPETDVTALVLWSRLGDIGGSAALRRARSLGLPVYAAGPGWPTRVPASIERLRTLTAAVDTIAGAANKIK